MMMRLLDVSQLFDPTFLMYGGPLFSKDEDLEGVLLGIIFLSGGFLSDEDGLFGGSSSNEDRGLFLSGSELLEDDGTTSSSLSSILGEDRTTSSSVSSTLGEDGTTSSSVSSILGEDGTTSS